MKNLIRFAPVAIALAGVLMYAAPASAATFQSLVYSNGQPTITQSQGGQISGTVYVVPNANETVDHLQFIVTYNGNIATGLPPQCVAVGPAVGSNQFSYTFGNIAIPTASAGYGVEIRSFGSNNPRQIGDGCVNDSVTVQNGDSGNLFNGTINITNPTVYNATNPVQNNGFVTTGSGSLTLGSSDILTLIAELKALGFNITAPGSSGGSTGGTVTGANCPVMIYTGDNAWAVQSWLMSHGQSAPFSQVGVNSPTGFWGNASKAAYSAAVNACK